VVEANETVNLTLSGPTGGAVLGARSTALLTIVDNDAPGMLAFSAATYSHAENGSARITVSRTKGLASGVTVDYATSDATATAGSDYTASSGTLSFGVASASFAVPITNDTLAEGNETINLRLNNPTGGATLGARDTALLTLLDNDFPGVIAFRYASYSRGEAGASATISVTRTKGLASGVSVDYATSDGSATAGSDYRAQAGTLSFAAGVATVTFSVPIINDTLVEGNETVNLSLSNPTGGATLGTQKTATLTIVDNDH
jgi:hypothetical protein